MAFNINEIRAQLTFGGARPTLFNVSITNPVNRNADIKIPFLVQAATLPASTIGTIDVPYFGRKIKLAGDRTFGPWTVTVINDEDFLIRNSLESWLQDINSHLGNVRAIRSATPLQYKSTAEINQFSKTGAILRTYRMEGIYPNAVQEIEMNWNTNSQLETFEVTFDYDWWEISGGITGDAGGN